MKDERAPNGLSPQATALGVLALTLLATLLRLYRLADPSLLADELFQVRSALSFGDLMLTKWLGYLPTLVGLQLTGVDLAGLEPEAYAQFARHGMNEWNMRVGTTVVGIATVPLLAWASLDFLGRRGALLLALLLAVVPWHVEWSQHARFYTPTFLAFNLAVALYLSGTLRGSPRRVAAAMVCTVLAVMCTPTSMMLFGLFALDGAWSWLRERCLPVDRTGLALVAGTGLLCLALFAWDATRSSDNLSGFLERQAGLAPQRVALENVYRSGLGLVIVASFSVLALWRQQPRTIGALTLAAGIPLLAFTALAPFSHVEDRYTFVNLYGWTALAAAGLSAIWTRLRTSGSLALAAAPVAALVGVMLLENLAYYQSAYGKRARFKHAFGFVGSHRSPDEPLYTLNVWGGRFYLADPDVKSVFEDFPGFEALASEGRSAWFVVKSTGEEMGRGRPVWLDGHADLLAVYPTRFHHPQTTLRVYRFQPDLSTGLPTGHPTVHPASPSAAGAGGDAG